MLGMQLRRFFNEPRVIFMRLVKMIQKFRFELIEYLIASWAGILKCVKAPVVPVKHNLLSRIVQVCDVNVYGLSLSNTIESANTLFEQIWIQRQIK